MTATDTVLSISAVAAATGLSTHALRYYEQEGLLRDAVDRASSSHRRYTEADVAWVIFLTKLRSTGMPISEIRRYTELARMGESTNAERRALLVEHRDRVKAQLEETARALAAIEHKIDIYERIAPL